MDRILFLCMLWFPYFCCTVADRPGTVSLYGGSSVGRCSSAGWDNYLTFIGNYTDLRDALQQLEQNETTDQFTHFTVCLRDGIYALSPVNLTVSVGIQAAAAGATDRSEIHCRVEPNGNNYSAFFYGSAEVLLENVDFVGCSSPIGLELVQNVVVANCTFRYFIEAVFDIFNCQDINIIDSIFEHNSGNGLSEITSRGNTGGVAIGYRNSPPYMREVSVVISHTMFVNNTAFSTSFLLALDRLVYPGRGGALGMFMSHAFDNVSVSIVDCTFLENIAVLFGGGIFYLVTHESYRHQLLIENTTFDSNSGLFGASGVMLANVLSLGESPEGREPVQFKIQECRFLNHISNSGGSISLFPSYLTGRGSQMILSDSVFVNNRENESDPFAHGSAIAISEMNIFSDRSSIPIHQITNCTFVNNSGQNGVVNNGYAPVLFSGTNRFIGNKGTPLKLVGSLVELSGQMDFINNTVSDGAALFFTSFAQARLKRGLKILFEGNVGRLGASVFVDNPTFNLSSLYNPLCFFLYEDSTVSPTQWEDINITTVRNSALEGSTLYIRRLEPCNWFSLSPPFINNTAIQDWPIWDIRNNSNTGFEGDMKTDASEMSVITQEVAPWPGQKFPVSLTVADQFDLPTSVTAQFLFNAGGDGGERVVLQPELTTITSRAEFTQLFSCVTSSQDANGTVLISNGLQSKAFQTQLQVLNSFGLEVERCPGGYIPMAIETRENLWGCVCDTGLEDLVLCSQNQDTVFIRAGMWATYVPPESGSPNLQFYPCPPGYCSCVNTDVSGATCMYAYTNSNPDLQCSCNRRGILCGECSNTSSVTALYNRCSDCSKHSFILIPGLILVDVVVFAAIAVLNAPLPEWTYPFLFYIQMAPYAVQYFPLSFNSVGRYLYFIGSATSFYFVYDFCLYDGMTTLGGSALAYLPLLTAAATLLPLLGLKLCKSKRRSIIKYHGLWVIVLLSFSHVVNTSMSLLNCPSITDSNGHTSYRWFLNGEVECFTGSHLYLAVVAGIILILAFLLTVTTAVLPLTQGRYTERQWVTKLSNSLSYSYRDKREWWAGVELARRVFLLFFLLVSPRNTTLVILVLAGILTLFGHAYPYKHRLANISEVAILTNFIILLAIRQTPYVIDEYFQFPNEEEEGRCSDQTLKGVATISWILLPLYYLPVLVFAVVIAVRIALYGGPVLWAHLKKVRLGRREEGGFQDVSLSMSHIRPATSMHTTYTSFRVARGLTHGVASVIRSKKKKLSSRHSPLELRATSTDQHELTDPFL